MQYEFSITGEGGIPGTMVVDGKDLILKYPLYEVEIKKDNKEADGESSYKIREKIA